MRNRTLRTPRGQATGRRRKAGTGVLLLLGLFAGLIGFAPAAFAHHPAVNDADVVCSTTTPGGWTVTGTSTAWPGPVADRFHNDVEIYWGPESIVWPLEDPNAPAGAILGDEDVYTGPSFTFSYSFEITPLAGLVAGDVIDVISHTNGDWVNGSDGDQWSGVETGGTNSAPIVKTLPSLAPCEASPSATATLECAQDRVQLSFTGVAVATTVDISKNGVIVAGGDNFAVPVGGPTLFSVPLDAADEDDPALDIDLDYLVGTDQAFDINVNCDNPQLGLNPAVECITGPGGVQGVNVTVTNTGTQAGSITLTTLVNAVAGPSLTFTNIAVGATSAPQFLAVPEDGSYSVSGPGVTTQAGTNDCLVPDLGFQSVVECVTSGGVQGVNVSVINTGGQIGDITGTATVGGVAVPNLVFTGVAPNGGTQTIFLAVPEDSAYTVTVDGVVTSDVNDCARANLSLVRAVECATVGGVQGLNVTITNNGGQAGSATVTPTVGSVAGTPITVNVAAGASVTSFVAVGEDVSYSLAFAGDFGAPQSVVSGVNDCAPPEPPPCVPTGENNQCTPCADDETPDGLGACTPPPVDVCTEIPGNQAEGTDCELPAVVDACPEVAGIQAMGTDCTTQVLGNVVTPTAVGGTTLARTGTNTTDLIGLAGLLLLAGAFLMTGARRREPGLLG